MVNIIVLIMVFLVVLLALVKVLKNKKEDKQVVVVDKSKCVKWLIENPGSSEIHYIYNPCGNSIVFNDLYINGHEGINVCTNGDEPHLVSSDSGFITNLGSC